MVLVAPFVCLEARAVALAALGLRGGETAAGGRAPTGTARCGSGSEAGKCTERQGREEELQQQQSNQPALAAETWKRPERGDKSTENGCVEAFRALGR